MSIAWQGDDCSLFFPHCFLLVSFHPFTAFSKSAPSLPFFLFFFSVMTLNVLMKLNKKRNTRPLLSTSVTYLFAKVCIALKLG